MLGLSRYGNFHRNDDRIGVELETTLVDEGFRKPVEEDFEKAILATLHYENERMQRGVAALKGRDRRKRRMCQKQLEVNNLYERLLTDPDAEIPVSVWDFPRVFLFKDAEALFRMSIKYCIGDFREFAQKKYGEYVQSGKEDRGLEEILDTIESANGKKPSSSFSEPRFYVEMDGERKEIGSERAKEILSPIIEEGAFSINLSDGPKTDSPDEFFKVLEGCDFTFELSSEGGIRCNLERRKPKSFRAIFSEFKNEMIRMFKPWAVSLVGHSIASAYANKALPTYTDIAQGLSSEERKVITYDSSDAIEIITTPCRTLEDVKSEFMRAYERIRPELDDRGLKLLFAARLPDAVPTGWKERLGRGEPQNVFGMHVHFGRVNDEFEAAAVYEAYRRVSPEIMALTANSGVSSNEEQDVVSERQVLYRNLIPEGLDVSPAMSWSERRKLRMQMKDVFGTNSEYEQSSQHSLEGAIEDAMRESGMVKGKKKKADIVKGSRGYSCVYMRPELGTIEVRMVDVQSDYDDNTLEGQVDANLVAVELIDAIGRAAVDAYRNGEMIFADREDLNERYERAIQLGLSDSELQTDSDKLLSRISLYLSEQALEILQGRVSEGVSPATRQKEIFRESGREGLYSRIAV